MQKEDVPSGVRAVAAGVEKAQAQRRAKAVATRPAGPRAPWRLLLLPFLLLLLVVSILSIAAEVVVSLGPGWCCEDLKEKGGEQWSV
jgi:hypothetical protein